ncbi:SO_0444 family Cu/Zn efflux transporter [uncultured Vibrio sp.]|uniref:SO_0444 family Cu/Zn efflux transporter n=1 Tax=uncultured Vibrio sp. TaxID=114054 RepID=UPI002AA72138|nr:SO_0444 family Cu/Zn efflux transporter [uncultured Vibrio sp.]
MQYLIDFLAAGWHLLEESSLYILLGLLVAGLLKVFLSPDYVATHLGKGRIKSVFKAALLGVPIPLCSCGVLPAAAQLKRQGANKGATTAFLISTPESGADSIAVSWALLDPLMTVARPVAAFISAFVAGVLENFIGEKDQPIGPPPLQMASVGAACSDAHCGCQHSGEKRQENKLLAGVKYAVNEIWGDLAGWFFVGIAVAAIIITLIPDDFISHHLGGGIGSMLLMLAAGVPMYICATASTPIAAAMILKGVSPGAALVFLLSGPATNVAALAVLVKILGKRGLAIYLVSIAVISVACGLALDSVYFSLGISAIATIGQVSEAAPHWLMVGATILLLALSIRQLQRVCQQRFAHNH